jgi:predicted amidophosphoribosyltransferase
LVSGINLGEVWVQNNLIYPIRSTIQNKTKPVCRLCGKPVYQEGNLCVDCFNIQQRKVNRPNRDELK